jgi:hypothetical protein
MQHCTLSVSPVNSIQLLGFSTSLLRTLILRESL